MKIRVFGIEAKWYEKMGAVTVLLPGEELYTGLATGVIDGARWGCPSNTIGMGLHEQAPYVIYPASMPAPGNCYLANPKAWNSLTDDLKAIIDDAAQYSGFQYLVCQDAFQVRHT